MVETVVLSLLMQAAAAEAELIKIEKAVRESKGLRVGFEWSGDKSPPEMASKTVGRGTILMKPGNLLYLKHVSGTEGLTLISDGSTLYGESYYTTHPDVRRKKAPSNLAASVAASLVYQGPRRTVEMLWASLDEEQEGSLGGPSISDYEARDALEDGQGRTVAYSLRRVPGEILLRYDPKSLSLLGRRFTQTPRAGDVGPTHKVVDTYPVFELNAELSDDLFNVPK